VQRVASLPPEAGLEVTLPSNATSPVQSWAEHLTLAEGSTQPFGHFSAQGSGRRSGLTMAGVQTDRATYLGFHPSKAAAKEMLRHMAATQGLAVQDLGPDLRVRRTKGQTFVTNFGQAAQAWGDQTPQIGQNPILPGTTALFS